MLVVLVVSMEMIVFKRLMFMRVRVSLAQESGHPGGHHEHGGYVEKPQSFTNH